MSTTAINNDSTSNNETDSAIGKPQKTSVDIEQNNNNGGSSNAISSFVSSEPLAPGKFGSMASYATMIVVMVASIICRRYASFPVIGKIDIWVDDCPDGYDDQCRANQAILRFSFALSILFSIQLVVTAIYPRFYDTLWIVKWAGLLCLVIGFFYAKPEVFDNHGYAWFARIGGFFFVILQQVILLDFAFAWNERWVSNDDNPYEDTKPWLAGLLAVSIFLFAGSISAIGVMFWQFSGPDCSANNVILSLTLVFSFLATAFQLTLNKEYSLLTSAVMTAYATYIAYSAVVLNPNQHCNPTLHSGYQTVSEVIGIGLAILSITWATRTAVQKVASYAPETSAGESSDPYRAPGLPTILMELAAVFILGATYYAMVLTNWSTLQSNGSLANPRTGYSSMWLQASAQWIALLLYVWALLAPILFPDRDFS